MADGDLDTLLKDLDKEFGKGAVTYLGSTDALDIKRFPSGSLRLDMALGGGLPYGRVFEFYGPESSGKTTLALHAALKVQQKGGAVAFIDAEHALDPVYAKAIGVDIDRMLISQPDTAEQCLNIIQRIASSGAVDLIILDSVEGMVSKKELEGEAGDAMVGLKARLMSQALRKLTGVSSKNGTSIIFINQIREKVGVMFGSPETTPGGRGLKFYSSIRLDIRRIETVKDKKTDEATGNRVRVKVIKNKTAAPYRIAEFTIYFGEGISTEQEILEEAVGLDIVKKSGAWYTLPDEQQYQGITNAVLALEENPEMTEDLEMQVWAAFSGGEIRE